MVLWSGESQFFLGFSAPPSLFLAPSAGTVECSDCISAAGLSLPTPMSVLDMILNNLMVRLQ